MAFAEVGWKNEVIEAKKKNLEKYLKFCEVESDYLLSRLQMYWKNRYTDVFIKGGDFSHGSGQAAVATVRYSGSRDWATDYIAPKLEDVIPYYDDDRGMYLMHKESMEMEYVHPSETGHIIEGINRKIMSIVKDAAFLYWWTGDVTYAELALPVFMTYIQGMYHRNPPVDLLNSNQQKLSGLATFEVIHEKIVKDLALTYDFLYDYLKMENQDLQSISSVFQRWGDQIIQNGVADNNWNFFQARFLTYIALVLEDDDDYANRKGRNYYLKYTFDESTERQTALKDAVLEYDVETGFWFESSSYSLHVTSTLLEILTVLDNYSHANELKEFDIVEKATLASFQYLFPSGYTVGFGDAKHGIIPPAIFEMLLSFYKKYQEADKAVKIAQFLETMMAKKDYERKGNSLFELFFYQNDLKVDAIEAGEDLGSSLLWPTFYAPNVSYFVQRLGQGTDGLMVATTGSFGNHAHSNGISIELFANHYVLGPDMSKGTSYWHPYYREYYSQYPAHNTVVVDGISATNRMRGHAPFTLDHFYPPAESMSSIFDKLTFSAVSFVEPKTQSDQHRFTAQILTETGKGYIVDVFRSKKQVDSHQKHEYIYHNIGQSLDFYNKKNQPLTLSLTNELTSENGQLKAYDYFTDKNHIQESGPVKAVFKIRRDDESDQKMIMWIKGSEDQDYFSVLSPPSDALSPGTAPVDLVDEKIPTVIVRKNNAAWLDPFSVVYNPFIGEDNPLSNVTYMEMKSNPAAQKIVVHHGHGNHLDELVINASVNDVVTENDFYQKGLFSVVRKGQSFDDLKFIFLGGVYQFKYGGWEILAKGRAVNLSLEAKDEGYNLQNDEAVVVFIPIDQQRSVNTMTLYKDGEIVGKKRGFESRVNPQSIKFRLSQGYDRVYFSFE
ncbi:heparinase II/III family protein [Membranihabitans marinus]